EGIVILLLAGKVNRHQRFPPFRPGLVLHHPYRAWTFTQQMPVGWGKDHRFELVVLVRHLQYQIVTTADDLLDNGFKWTVVPDHFNLNGDTRIDIVFSLFLDPGGALTNDALSHSGT